MKSARREDAGDERLSNGFRRISGTKVQGITWHWREEVCREISILRHANESLDEAAEYLCAGVSVLRQMDKTTRDEHFLVQRPRAYFSRVARDVNSQSRDRAPGGWASQRGRRDGGWGSAAPEGAHEAGRLEGKRRRQMGQKQRAKEQEESHNDGVTVHRVGCAHYCTSLVCRRITLRMAADVRAAPSGSEQVEVEGSGVRERANDFRGARRVAPRAKQA
ncbi:hypothetical protein FB451DRAFT_1165021 [Mycena latifolia]|nr:hypothetical protein FB451DRAFT_1165021 [Mycena latifolia]